MKLIKGEEIPISGVFDRLGVAIEGSLQGGVGIKEDIPMDIAFLLTFILVFYYIVLIVVECIRMYLRKHGDGEDEQYDKFTKIFWGVVKTVVLVISPVLITASVYVLVSIINVPNTEEVYYGNYELQGTITSIEDYSDGLGENPNIKVVGVDGVEYEIYSSELEGISTGESITITAGTRIYDTRNRVSITNQEEIIRILEVNGYEINKDSELDMES